MEINVTIVVVSVDMRSKVELQHNLFAFQCCLTIGSLSNAHLQLVHETEALRQKNQTESTTCLLRHSTLGYLALLAGRNRYVHMEAYLIQKCNRKHTKFCRRIKLFIGISGIETTYVKFLT